ncbi:hypothetical protein [Sediminibacterium ginsengisoli]|uniref:Adhesin domain-containing protein n=1 Tax=Sediminibacterium ginsengisoli TaxID=413434 RepID=A0A1T4K0H4_9BACT|nr:hypothetical protein [Sediminibacterium ginsengisoli]SJZ35921.1 hypothetical protein SAMN04488132_101360 [Sediminibacterium ginsengisoli]
MKKIAMMMVCLIALGASAQTTVTRSYPVKQGQQVALDFDFPKVVKVSTWDKNEVYVKATVSINDGENDSAFVLEDKSKDGVLSISNRIKDRESLPKRYTIMRDGQKLVFKTRGEMRAFGDKNGIRNYYSEGVDMDITLEIKVPAGMATDIKAKYGIVELVGFNGPVTVTATYGGIDATVQEANTGKLSATTNYGQIYSNLDLKVKDYTEKNFYTSFTAEPGKGPAYILTSKYGKIYLRKP